MRSWLCVALVACSGSSGQHGDAAVDSTPADVSIDAGFTGTCSGLVRLPFAAQTAYDVAYDGATLYLSVLAADGSAQLVTMPMTGGPTTRIATADADRFYIAAFGNAIAYAAQLGTTEYMVHLRVGATDTELGGVPSIVPIVVALNATDVYVVGSDAQGQGSMWRLSRAGGAGLSPPKVTTIAYANPTPAKMVLGLTKAAWSWQQTVELVDIPGPATAVAAAPADRGHTMIDDSGYVLASVPYGSSHSHKIYVQEYTGGQASLLADVVLSGDGEDLFSDSGHFYFIERGDASAQQTWVYLKSMNLDGTGPGPVFCDFAGSRGAQDATNLYGLQAAPWGGVWAVNVIPKLP